MNSTRRESVLAWSELPSCILVEGVYNGFTNQVPATWIVGEAGIRRLASHSDGPFGGRRFVFTESGETYPATTIAFQASNSPDARSSSR